MQSSLLSSTSQAWRTPATLLAEIVCAIGPIKLDPCAADDPKHHFAETNWTIIDDGLARSWRGHGTVFCNPPYGRALPRWSAKIVEESNAREPLGDALIALVPARTDTRWFTSLYRASSALCLLRGRVKFSDSLIPAPFPSALFYFGRRPNAFARVFAVHGIVPT